MFGVSLIATVGQSLTNRWVLLKTGDISTMCGLFSSMRSVLSIAHLLTGFVRSVYSRSAVVRSVVTAFLTLESTAAATAIAANLGIHTAQQYMTGNNSATMSMVSHNVH
jgi:hypothetical protein